MWQAPNAGIPLAVASEYGSILTGLSWRRVDGGFSGARVWRGDADAASPRVALKCWPAGFRAARLRLIHDWMDQAAERPFVPRVLRTLIGTTLVQADGYIWDATTWVPGLPRNRASLMDVDSVCSAVASLHLCWKGEREQGPSPGIQRRIEVLESGLPESFPGRDRQISPELYYRAKAVIAEMSPRILAALRSWATVIFTLQPCLRDLRGEHVLFTGNEVTGIVDFGAMAVDTPAFDLARMLGDLAGCEEEAVRQGLEKYAESMPEFEASVEFIVTLDRAGVIGSIVGWLRRLSEGETPVSSEKSTERLERLVSRAEGFRETRTQ